MKTLKILTIAATLMLCCSAGELQAQTRNADIFAKDTAYMFLFEPDNKLTDEQLNFKYKIGELFIDQILVEDNQLKTTIKEEDFRKANLPTKLYTMLKQNMEEVNRFVVENKIKDLQRMVVSAKKDFRRTLEKYRKAGKIAIVVQ